MKKRILTICIAILTILVCIFSVACTSRESFEVKEISMREGGKSAAQLTAEICEKHPDRTMGTGKDLEFLEYLIGEMASYGYPSTGLTPEPPGGGTVPVAATDDTATVRADAFEFKNMYTNSTEIGYNLVYEIPSAPETKKTVLLLASYDNCASIEVASVDLTTGQTAKTKIGGEGAYATATGVATVLRLAYELADDALPYNLVIAFTDCSENAWDGAQIVAEQYAELGKDLICLNFGKLGAGDLTYVYSDETEQPYNDYFYSVIGKTDKDGVFAEIPVNKQIAEMKFLDGQKTDYSHYAMYGDNLVFNVYGLAVANYVSFNWSSFENPFYTETSGYENVLDTGADTYEEMINRLGGEGKGEEVLAKRLDAVVLNAATAINADNAETLFGALEKSDPAKSGDFADKAGTAALIVKIVLVAAAVAAAVLLTVKGRNTFLKKQKEKLERMQREAMDAMQNNAPSAEDIFSLGGDKKDDDGKGGNSGGSTGGSDGDVFKGF